MLGMRARKRNTPSLINVAVFRSSFDWDGRATTLEKQLRGVFSITGDMGMELAEAVERLRSDPTYDGAFRRAYGRPVDVATFLAALVAFQESLVVSESSFDRFYLGGDSTALLDSAKRGWEFFRSGKGGCAGCHSPRPDYRGKSGILIFRDDAFHNLGVGYSEGLMEDAGRYMVTNRPMDWGKFQTPTLHNIALTAPYMHDGSLKTLEDVIDFYSDGGNDNPNLDAVMVRRDFTKQERADLVAFLRSLTTEWLMDSTAVRRRLLRSHDDGSITQLRTWQDSR